MVAVTSVLADNIAGAWGAAGWRWLADLPRLVDELVEVWSVRV